MEESETVRARKVVNITGGQASACHTKHRRHQYQADADACLAWRQIPSDDHRIHRNDAALEEAEQAGDHIERRLAVKEQIQ